MVKTFDYNTLGNGGFNTGPDLPWQVMRFKPKKDMQLSFTHISMVEEHERILAELATRLEVILGLVLNNKN